MAQEPTYVSVQARGVLALPAEIRRKYNLDRPGSQVEVIERNDGVIELRPQVPVPADQAWFWTERWQSMEHAVDKYVERGRVLGYEGPDELFEHLESLDS